MVRRVRRTIAPCPGPAKCYTPATMALRSYAERCAERQILLEQALGKVVAVCRAEPEVVEAFVFGSFAVVRVGPTSDLDVLVVRDTALGIVDRVADLKVAAQARVGLDLIVVTPQEYRSTFAASSFGRTVLAQAKRVYAA